MEIELSGRPRRQSLLWRSEANKGQQQDCEAIRPLTALRSTNPAENQVEIRGKLTEMDALRHTPAGIPVLKFKLGHESTQLEAGVARKVSCEIEGIAFEREARLLATAAPGLELTLRGFLDRKSRNSERLVLHATQIEFENK